MIFMFSVLRTFVFFRTKLEKNLNIQMAGMKMVMFFTIRVRDVMAIKCLKWAIKHYVITFQMEKISTY